MTRFSHVVQRFPVQDQSIEPDNNIRYRFFRNQATTRTVFFTPPPIY